MPAAVTLFSAEGPLTPFGFLVNTTAPGKFITCDIIDSSLCNSRVSGEATEVADAAHVTSHVRSPDGSGSISAGYFVTAAAASSISLATSRGCDMKAT